MKESDFEGSTHCNCPCASFLCILAGIQTPMNRFYPLLFLLLSQTIAPATWGNSEMDSLNAVLRNSRSDTHRVRILNRAGFLQKESATDSALGRLKESIALAQELGFSNGEAQARMYIGQALTATGDYPGALSELEQAISLYTSSGDINGAGKAWNSIGIVRYYQSDYSGSAEAYTNALERFSKPFYIATTYNNIANAYKLAGNPEAYVDNQLKALEKFTELEQPGMQLYCLSNLAIFYQERGDLEQARRFNRQGYELVGDAATKEERISLDMVEGEIELVAENYDRAVELFRGVRTLAEELGMGREEATAWANLGSCYGYQGNYELSRSRGQKAYQRFVELEDIRGQSKTLLVIARAQLEMGQGDSALQQLQTALGLALELEEPALLALVYDQLSHAYDVEGDASNALHYRNRYTEAKAEVMDPVKWRSILEMENGYLRKQQEATIAELTADRDAATEENRLLVWGLLGVLLLSLGGMGLGFWRYRRQYAKMERREKNQATLEHLDLLLENAEAKGRIHQLREQLKQKEKAIQSLRRNPLAQAPQQTLLPPDFETLSAREVEVFLCLGEGLSDKDIAEELSISVATVRTHARNVYGKLNLSNRAGAVKLAHEFRLLRKNL